MSVNRFSRKEATLFERSDLDLKISTCCSCNTLDAIGHWRAAAGTCASVYLQDA